MNTMPPLMPPLNVDLFNLEDLVFPDFEIKQREAQWQAKLNALQARCDAAESKAQGYINMYARLCEAAEYDSGKDDMEFSPEEWFEKLKAERDALQARCDAAELNAARYREVRSWYWKTSEFAVVQNPKQTMPLGSYGAYFPSLTLLDLAVDTAMKETK